MVEVHRVEALEQSAHLAQQLPGSRAHRFSRPKSRASASYSATSTAKLTKIHWPVVGCQRFVSSFSLSAVSSCKEGQTVYGNATVSMYSFNCLTKALAAFLSAARRKFQPVFKNNA